MKQDKYSIKRRRGNFAEDMAARFLMKHGFNILERNYLRKCGEIDIVAAKRDVTHFVEVKSSFGSVERGAVIHETEKYRPEENLHGEKLKRLHRTIQSYLLQHEKVGERDWQIDLITVLVDTENRKAKIGYLPNIVL